MRILLAILLALVVGGCGGCVSTGGERYHATTKQIQIGPGGKCSATAVGPNAILTAAHCFPSDVPLILVNGRVAKVLKFERDGKDHLLLKVDIGFKQYARRGPPAKVGETVCIYGNPGHLTDQFRCGMVSGKWEDSTLYDLASFHGDSGSGVFDRSGRLIAVLSGGISYINPANSVHFQLMRTLPLAFTAAQWKAVGA